jgi:3-deoxy-7-phosphoheptulonate synthase
MGKKINDFLPQIVKTITRKNLNVVWICDPMHGNTIKLKNGLKTRLLKDIQNEFESFVKILTVNKVYPAGIHLELTGKDVIECLNDKKNIPESMASLYETSCDPRLSASQCLELAFAISNMYKKM